MLFFFFLKRQNNKIHKNFCSILLNMQYFCNVDISQEIIFAILKVQSGTLASCGVLFIHLHDLVTVRRVLFLLLIIFHRWAVLWAFVLFTTPCDLSCLLFSAWHFHFLNAAARFKLTDSSRFTNIGVLFSDQQSYSKDWCKFTRIENIQSGANLVLTILSILIGVIASYLQ